MNTRIWHSACNNPAKGDNLDAGNMLIKLTGIVSLAILLLLCGAGSVSAAWDGTVNDTWLADESAAGHTGTLTRPYLVHDEASLAALANETNVNTSINGFFDKHILLTANLDLNGDAHQWPRIGNRKDFKFKGSFDGDGHTITNMNITYSTTGEWYRLGLFGYADNATIQDIHLENAVVQITTTSSNSCSYAGGLVGESLNNTEIRNCTVVGGTIYAKSPQLSYAGGIVAWSKSTNITNCTATGGTVSAVSDSDVSHAGGLVGGANNSRITNGEAMVTVNAKGKKTTYAGGLVGRAVINTNITTCTATGTVDANGSSNTCAGGLVGGVNASCNITTCTATGTVSATGVGTTYAGGLVAFLDYYSTIINCTATGGTVSAVSDSDVSHAGGLIGRTSGFSNIISSKTKECTVNTTGSYDCTAGGLVGIAEYSNTIIDCTINCGNVAAKGSGSVYIGGLIGCIFPNIDDRTTSVTDCSVTASKIKTLPNSGSACLGGLAGYATNATIKNIRVDGTTVTADSRGLAYVGGILGRGNKSSITNCYTTSTSTVTARSFSSPASAGGILGWGDKSSITNCYATSTVTAQSSISPASAGGILGRGDKSSITNCYATSPVTADSPSVPSYAGGLVGNATDSTITNSVALNDRINTNGTPGNIGRLAGSGTPGNETYAWRHMTLNNSTTTTSVPAGGKHATNASTVMIWDNETFFKTLFSGYALNWIMSTDAAYQLPILNNIAAPVGNDASYLNVNHNITVKKTGDGTITRLPPGATIPDGASVIFTLSPSEKLISLTDTGTDIIPPPGTYTIADMDRSHSIVAVFQQTPVPTPSGGGSGSGDGNMDTTFRILFETNGGSFISPVTGLSYGDIISEPPAPTKSGYAFGGWYTDESCTTAWDFTTGIPGDMTLYAKWISETTPTITPTSITTQTVQPVTTQPTIQPVTMEPTTEPTMEPQLGDNDNTKPAGSILHLLGGILILFLIFILLLIFLLRHTVTLLIPAAEGIEYYRIRVWHGRYIDRYALPSLLRTADWYTDKERNILWDFEKDRVKKNITLYLG